MMAEGITGEHWADWIIDEHKWQSSGADPEAHGWDVAPTMSELAMEHQPAADGTDALARKGFVVIPGRRTVNGGEHVAIFIDPLGPDGKKTRYTLDAERALFPESAVDTAPEL